MSEPCGYSLELNIPFYSFGLLCEIHLIVSSDSLFYLKQYYQQESAKLRNQIQMLQNTNR